MSTNSPGLASWPNPDAMMTVAGFYGGLKQAKEVSAKSCRVIEKESKELGCPVSRTAIGGLCDNNEKSKLPSFKQVEGFLLGCGLTHEQLVPWQEAYTRIKKLTAQDEMTFGITKEFTETPGKLIVTSPEDSGRELPPAEEEPTQRKSVVLLIAIFTLGVVVGSIAGALLW